MRIASRPTKSIANYSGFYSSRGVVRGYGTVGQRGIRKWVVYSAFVG